MKRPIIFLVSGLCAALFAACYLQAAFAYLLPVILLSAGAFVLLRGRKWASTVLCTAIGMAVGLLCWYGNLWLVYQPAAALSGRSGELVCRVEEYPTVYEDYTAVTVRAETLSGEKIRRCRILLYLDGDWSDLAPGDRVEASAKLSVPENKYDFDRFRYYRAHRIFLTGSTTEAAARPAERVPLRYLPVRLTRLCTSRLRLLVPEKNAAVLAGLIFGDVSGLSDDYTADLRTTGLSHITAVSGMNVSFLVGLILLLFRRRAGTWIAIPTVVLFIIMTGGSASVTRAGIMQLLWLIAFLIDREADPMNSLFLACGIILLSNPFAIADVGLWLSFAATLGLMLFSMRMLQALMRKIQIRITVLRRVLEALAGAVCATISAQIFVLPIQIVVFGDISLIAPLSNLLVVPASEYAFTLGVAALLVSVVWLPPAVILAWIPRVLTSFQLSIVPWLARIPLASISAASPYVLLCAAFLYLVGLLWYFHRSISKRLLLLCAGAAVAAAVLCAVADALLLAQLSIVDTQGGQSVVLCDWSANVVINCGGGSSSACREVTEALHQSNARKIDLLILTDYRSADAGNAETLLRSMRVETLLLPEPAGDEDALRLSEIEEAARNAGTAVVRCREDRRFSSGDLSITVYQNEAEGRDRGRLMPVLDIHGCRLLCLGSIYPENVGELLDRASLDGVEIIAAGDSYAQKMIPPAALRLEPEICVFSSYAGADRDVLSRVSAWNVTVMETERQGKISFRLPRLYDMAKYRTGNALS